MLVTCQSGFIKGDSCINQLLEITHSIHKNIDANRSKDTRCVFLDMSEALGKVWHDGLIFKFRSHGIISNLLFLLKNYLLNRNQRVIINGLTSSWKPIKSCVPQGSLLGPLLFLILINDLPENLICNPKLFAADVSLSAFIHDNIIYTANLRDDLKRIHDWYVKWKMVFNPDANKPTKEIIFTNRNYTLYDTISFAERDVMSVSNHKHLGLIRDNKVTSSNHIDDCKFIDLLYNCTLTTAMLFITNLRMMILRRNIMPKELPLIQ